MRILTFFSAVLSVISHHRSFACGLCPAGTRPDLTVNFNNRQIGTAYTQSQMRSDFKTTRSNNVLSGARIVQGFNGAGLQITYPEGCVGTPCTLWLHTALRPTNEVYVSFRIRLERGWVFMKGGKLPGICGGVCNSGGNPSNGVDGFSNRIMWRREGALVSYAYYPGQANRHGDDFPWNAYLSVDKWTRLSQRVVLNTPGSRNGILQAFVDGTRVSNRSNMNWRTASSLRIDAFQFSNFFGGSSPDWAPTHTVRAVYDDILVCTR